MFKSALRAAPKRILPSRSLLNSPSTRRFLSTAPPSQKSRSWKSSAARWALAGVGVYYYNTSNVFAEEPEAAIQEVAESIQHVKEKTIEQIAEEKRQRQAEEYRRDRAAKKALEGGEEQVAVAQEGEEGMEGLEDEAGQQGAFNEETGEINWDCPCLGGMAHGPCGEEFKAAFSCFVYSKEEVKGVECIEKFKGMQDCFREHPEMYQSELEDDEDQVEEELRTREVAQNPDPEAHSEEPESKPTQEVPSSGTVVETHQESQASHPDHVQKLRDEGGELLPKAVHDASASSPSN